MYCLMCRRITETENIATATSTNVRLIRRDQYVTCAKTKTQFVKSGAAGGSFLDTFVNNISFEMHLPGQNFTGPGTKLYKRLNLDGTLNEWSIPKTELTTQLIITIKAIQKMMILKQGIRFLIKNAW